MKSRDLVAGAAIACRRSVSSADSRRRERPRVSTSRIAAFGPSAAAARSWPARTTSGPSGTTRPGSSTRPRASCSTARTCTTPTRSRARGSRRAPRGAEFVTNVPDRERHDAVPADPDDRGLVPLRRAEAVRRGPRHLRAGRGAADVSGDDRRRRARAPALLAHLAQRLDPGRHRRVVRLQAHRVDPDRRRRPDAHGLLQDDPRSERVPPGQPGVRARRPELRGAHLAQRGPDLRAERERRA